MTEGAPGGTSGGADLVIRGGRVVSTFTGEIFAADVVVRGATIVAVLPPGSDVAAREALDARGLLVAPGYVDAHVHVESTFVTPAAFARLTLARGTTTVLADPHEIVNVAGKAALRWMIEAGQGTPQTILYGAPSCVPALAGFETAGAELGPDDIDEMLDWPGVLGLGEVMDFRAVIGGDARMLEIVAAARRKGKLIDGHCTGVHGAELSAFMAPGIDSDHTKNSPAVTLEKARLGMSVQLQEKCISAEMIRTVREQSLPAPFCLVTDDVAPDTIVREGHLDHVARRAVEAGLPPLEALRAMTWTPAQRLRLYDRGVVAPGKRADLVLLDGLDGTHGSGGLSGLSGPDAFTPRVVIAGGRVVARDGQATYAEEAASDVVGVPFGDSVKLAPRTPDDFRWPVPPGAGAAGSASGRLTLRAIRVNPNDTSTMAEGLSLPGEDGEVRWDGKTLLLAIFERHGKRGSSARAPVVGLDLSEGAVATTYAHDSHNLLVLGTSRRAMTAAANAVIEARGGMAVVLGERVEALLALPVGGLMSVLPVAQVVEQARAVRAALAAWGYRHANPFMSVSTLSLPVGPRLKLTDLGLVDVERRAWADPYWET